MPIKHETFRTTSAYGILTENIFSIWLVSIFIEKSVMLYIQGGSPYGSIDLKHMCKTIIAKVSV